MLNLFWVKHYVIMQVHSSAVATLNSMSSHNFVYNAFFIIRCETKLDVFLNNEFNISS